MLYSLPPAGDPIVLHSADSLQKVLEECFSPYQPHFYDSGTSALAAAIAAVVQTRDIENPQVLLPAYTCPHVVSAALFAGARPILVDFERDRPWMDLDDLTRKITPKTVAVVAVNLFGLPERLGAIRRITANKDLFVIEDSAQSFPSRETRSWKGDYIILSFSRGKPVSLLQGGAVLVADPTLGHTLPVPKRRRIPGWVERIAFHTKARLYNELIRPGLYWIPQALPFLGIGETKFRPLRGIYSPSRPALDLLSINAWNYHRRDTAAQRLLARMASEIKSDDVCNLSQLCCSRQVPRLLRYPLLLSTEELRDRLFKALRRAGLGPSKMYEHTLPQIPGLTNVLRSQKHFPCADNFAQRILTLPTHAGVQKRHVQEMQRIIEQALP